MSFIGDKAINGLLTYDRRKLKFYELYLAMNSEGLNATVAMVPGVTMADAHDMAVIEYRKRNNLPSSQHVVVKKLHVSDTLEEAERFHADLLELIHTHQKES